MVMNSRSPVRSDQFCSPTVAGLRALDEWLRAAQVALGDSPFALAADCERFAQLARELLYDVMWPAAGRGTRAGLVDRLDTILVVGLSPDQSARARASAPTLVRPYLPTPDPVSRAVQRPPPRRGARARPHDRRLRQ